MRSPAFAAALALGIGGALPASSWDAARIRPTEPSWPKGWTTKHHKGFGRGRVRGTGSTCGRKYVLKGLRP